MTITIAWVRQNKNTSELLVASHSRLRAYGAIDQAQKLFRLERGDCCLGFCGNAQVAYPLFVQVGTTLNNFVRTRTRAEDITDITDTIGRVLNNLIGSWDLPEADKADQLTSTRILFSGWSWKHRRFDIGFFMADGCTFNFHHRKMRISHPWHENRRSLVFIGDYEREYRSALFADFEREMIRARIMAGLRRSTKKAGRPPLDPEKAERIKRTLASGLSINATARKLRVGVGTVHRIKVKMAEAA